MAESSVRYTRLKFITARVAAKGADASFASSACGCLVRSIVPIASPSRNARCAPNFPASARIAWFSAPVVMRRVLYPLVRASSINRRNRLVPTPRLLTSASTDHAIFDVGNDHRAIIGASGGVAFDETVVEKPVEAVVPTLGIEAHQVIAQQRQYFLLR